jgi:hypothetical protein
MLSRRSLLGSLLGNLLASGVIAAPLATFITSSEAEAQPSPTHTGGTVSIEVGARVNKLGA